ncbi:diguanylate cyclase (GGDEF)-like protein [Ruminiclostridium sufflavum DSM 19573]|uniref:Diguanylate cyclase (GGDEF)-like protein n=1 Tax=Ruminiclostridium sufflavum DSM 19573 TaxID=1121337 RepID=A0A318XJW9_9FIRM|nr:GGDEF domain-containing phosphodiesterase [Ruminiclostridium sufflavum]PYG87620.1 diguanylate cyclase (GGDEF)-like protein [Ruminiclostridium sufflavum DSM 19573]
MKKSESAQKRVNRTICLANWTLVFPVLLYLFFLLVAYQINNFQVTIRIGDAVIPYISLGGIVSQFQMLIFILMVVFYRKRGLISLLALCTIQGILLIIPIITGKVYTSIAGIAILISSTAVSILIYLYLEKLDCNQNTIVKYAFTDTLTGLPNRRAFNDYLNQLISDYNDEEDKFALVMIDLDDFKNINDSVGHDSGDEILSEVVRRWKIVQGENDFIARIGGDEFTIIMKNYSSEEELQQRIRKYSTAISSRFTVNINYFYISASFGVALYPEDSKDSSEIFRYADVAMYHSKNNNNVNISMYNRSMTDTIENNVTLEQKIRTAIEENNLYFVLQPQYNTKTKKIRGFEALARMKDEFGNYISPSSFIPVAEKTGLIISIDNWVIRSSMIFFKKILEITKENLMLSVNISVLHLLNKGFLDEIQQMLDETGFPPSQLEIEITESVFISSMTKAIETLNDLKEIGVCIALDDFGTGYSSLSYLSKLPIDLLKIDKSFIDELLLSESGRNYVAAIISIGHIMNFSVISEGVESQKQLDILASLGSDYMQGYLWGKPMLPKDVVKLLGISA